MTTFGMRFEIEQPDHVGGGELLGFVL
jgi:hypothetical protein